MSQFISSSTKNPCPVCSRTHDNNCGWPADKKLVLCHTKANPQSKVPQPPDEVNGYRWNGKIREADTKNLFARAEYVLSSADTFSKSDRPAMPPRYFDYPDSEGNPLVRVKRIDKGEGPKEITQQWWNGSEWKFKGMPADVKVALRLYRISDLINQKAINIGTNLYLVEGETTVDRMLALGIPATTAIGGAGKWNQYGHANYVADLAECVSLVICPDCDAVGVQHGLQVASDFPNAKWLYADPTHYRWNNPFAGVGYDLGDWINELLRDGTDLNEVPNVLSAAVEKQRNFAEPEAVKPVALAPTPKPSANKSNEVVRQTIDLFIYDRLFGGGNGQYCTIDDAFYQYSEAGYWKVRADNGIRKEVAKCAQSAYRIRFSKETGEPYEDYVFGKEACVSSAYSFCRTLLEVDQRELDNRHLRAFRNCTLDLRTGKQLPHDRAHYLTSSIDADYYPDQECPQVFKDFIESAYGADLLPVVRACTSMLLDTTAPYGQFIHLLGPSGGGKGTLLRFWLSLYGPNQSRSGTDFEELKTPDHRHQNLAGISVYAFPDMGGFNKGMKAFYELVDNGPMSGRALFASSTYQKRWDVRFILASVETLQLENSGDGWHRRAIPLPLVHRNSKPDRNLEQKLQEVKSQVISWALAMPRSEREQILDNLRDVERIAIAQNETAISGDSVRAFVDACLIPDADRTDYDMGIHTFEMHSKYQSYCAAHGFIPMNTTRFASHLKNVLPGHFAPRRKGLASEGKAGQMIPSFWRGIDTHPGIFEASSNDATQFKCNRNRCSEGGLALFEDFRKMDQALFWIRHSPKEPDPSKVAPSQESTKMDQADQADQALWKIHQSFLSDCQEPLTNAENQENLQTRKFEPDLPDLPDPKNRSITSKGFEMDQALFKKTKEPDLPDPFFTPSEIPITIDYSDPDSPFI